MKIIVVALWMGAILAGCQNETERVGSDHPQTSVSGSGMQLSGSNQQSVDAPCQNYNINKWSCTINCTNGTSTDNLKISVTTNLIYSDVQNICNLAKNRAGYSMTYPVVCTDPTGQKTCQFSQGDLDPPSGSQAVSPQ